MIGRGMLVHREIRPMTRENFLGLGIDMTAEFRKLPEEKRYQGDYFSLITVLIPAAIWIVRLSLTDPSAAIAGGLEIASACRQLADDEWGDKELWCTAADLYEATSVERTNVEQILTRVRTLQGPSEGSDAVRVLGYILATWHAGTDEAIQLQLASIDLLLKWFSQTESVRRLILVPYIESYWRKAARESRFTFRSPDLTVSAIEATLTVPEPRRVQAILCAAAGGFHVGRFSDILRRLRRTLADAAGQQGE